MAEKAKYFCENCGAEVARNARFCPKCGKFFSSVRCPNCGHTGSVAAFKNGCPSCHYAVPGTGAGEAAPSRQATADGRKHRLSRKSKKAISSAFKEHDKNQASSEDVPVWLSVVSLLALILVGGLIFYQCQ